MEDKEISNDDVKKEFEELQNKQAEAETESSTEKTEVSEKTAEVVKTGTEGTTDETVKTEETEPKVIPYSRFKEVNDKVKNYEELEKEVGNLVERGPDGKLRIRVQEKNKEEEDEGLKLNEEEQLALDSVQTSVVSKLVAREFALRERQEQNNRVYREQSKSWWDKAQEEFPEVKNKEGEFYRRADKIFREQYVTNIGNGKWTSPPNGHYLSCLQAEKELIREKVKTSQSKIEEKKNQKQQVFVEKKSGQAQSKKKVDEKEFESFNVSEQEAALKEQWSEMHPDE